MKREGVQWRKRTVGEEHELYVDHSFQPTSVTGQIRSKVWVTTMGECRILVSTHTDQGTRIQGLHLRQALIPVRHPKSSIIFEDTSAGILPGSLGCPAKARSGKQPGHVASFSARRSNHMHPSSMLNIHLDNDTKKSKKRQTTGAGVEHGHPIRNVSIDATR